VRCIAAIGLLLFAGCSHDPLVVHNVYPGLVPVRAPQGELVPVLFSAADTPAQQGFLYVAMHDAGVAGQNASLARAAATPEGVMTRVGEVLYAIDPEVAPAWPAKRSGLVEVWAGSGYGLRRAGQQMIDEIGAALADGSASEALREYGPRAIQCTENTLARAERVLALGQQVLAGGSSAEVEPILPELDEVATALNNGVPSPGDEGCGLQQAYLYLSRIGLYAPTYAGV
jgi:hypothetical protein